MASHTCQSAQSPSYGPEWRNRSRDVFHEMLAADWQATGEELPHMAERGNRNPIHLGLDKKIYIVKLQSLYIIYT